MCTAAQNDNLSIHEDKQRGVYVKNITDVYVGSEMEVYKVMQAGGASRATSSTSELDPRYHVADEECRYECRVIPIALHFRHWHTSAKYRIRQSEKRESVLGGSCGIGKGISRGKGWYQVARADTLTGREDWCDRTDSGRGEENKQKSVSAGNGHQLVDRWQSQLLKTRMGLCHQLTMSTVLTCTLPRFEAHPTAARSACTT